MSRRIVSFCLILSHSALPGCGLQPRGLGVTLQLCGLMFGLSRLILSQKVCAGRSRTNVPTPGYNIQSLFRILPQHTVALRCAKSLELPQNGFLRGNQGSDCLGSGLVSVSVIADGRRARGTRQSNSPQRGRLTRTAGSCCRGPGSAYRKRPKQASVAMSAASQSR